MLNACTRLDSVVGNVETYIYGTLPSQVPIWKMVHESTAELVSEISGSWRTSVIGVVKAKTKKILRKLFLLLFPSCRERMMLFALLDHSKRFYEGGLHFGPHISDDYFAIAPPETPIRLRSSL